MRILVTGGAGFLGQAVVRALLDHDHTVRVFDLVEPTDLPRAEGYVGSVLDSNALCRAAESMDAAVHLAAMLGVRKTEERRLGCLEVNIQGTVNLLEACVKERVGRVLFASSSEVYGDSLELPIRETTPVQPRSIYAVSKLAGEEYVRSYSKRYGLKFAIARFFNVYGEGQVAEFVVPRFVRACQLGTGPVVYGDGTQERCFCHVDDTSRGFALLMMALAERTDEISGEIFNIGNPNNPTSMAELARLTVELADRYVPDKKLRINFVPFADSDRESGREITKRQPDITKARDMLDFLPQIGLAEGLERLFKSEIPDSWWEPHTIPEAARARGEEPPVA